VPEALNLTRRSLTRRLILQKARRHTGSRIRRFHCAPTACKYRVSDLFTSLDGMLFIVPSPYWFTIGRQLVLSLGRWSSLLHAGFHVSDATRGHILRPLRAFRYRAITFYGRAFQSRSRNVPRARVDGPTTPPAPEGPDGLGCSRFARRYSGNRCCFPFLGVLRCFTSPRSLPRPITLLAEGLQTRMVPLARNRVAPFGDPGVSACLAAHPGLSQPSASFIACWRQDIHPTLLVA
jgi:hypothetical protein